jgi:hypothetical protein
VKLFCQIFRGQLAPARGIRLVCVGKKAHLARRLIAIHKPLIRRGLCYGYGHGILDGSPKSRTTQKSICWCDSLRGVPGIALVSWRWHYSKRRRDCSRVLSVCIQATSPKRWQGLVWRVVMSPRARRAFSPTRWLPPTLIDDTRERNSAVQRKCYLVFFDTFTLQFHKFTK